MAVNPINRREAILSGESVTPSTRLEAILSGEDITPITREEYFVKEFSDGHGGGGGLDYVIPEQEVVQPANPQGPGDMNPLQGVDLTKYDSQTPILVHIMREKYTEAEPNVYFYEQTYIEEDSIEFTYNTRGFVFTFQVFKDSGNYYMLTLINDEPAQGSTTITAAVAPF